MSFFARKSTDCHPALVAGSGFPNSVGGFFSRYRNKCGMTTVILLSVFTACSPKVEERGYIKNSAEIADFKSSLVIGQTSKQEVLDKFGSPSAQSSFGAETWYYVSSKKESFAFLKPEMVEQEIADIQFDSGGVVSAVNFYNQNDAQNIALVKRTTPTEGHSLSFIDQTLGNLGRFNNPAGTSSGGPRGSRLPN